MNFDCDFSEFAPAAAANTASLRQAMEIVTGAEDAVESLDARFGRLRKNGWLKASGQMEKMARKIHFSSFILNFCYTKDGGNFGCCHECGR